MSHNTAESLEIQLKGTSYGLKIIFPNDLPDDLLLEKFEAIPDQTYVVPIGTGVVLDFQARFCSEELIGKILFKVVWPRGLNVLAWMTSDENASAQLRRAGFRTTEPISENAAGHRHAGNSETLIMNHSLRSGQQIEGPGNVVLIGHLNSGAEIFAGQSISVLGKLKGLVHAGLETTQGVYVIAASFEPQQVRIGDKLCAQVGVDMKWWKKPVIITLEEDKLLIKELKFFTGNEAVAAQ